MKDRILTALLVLGMTLAILAIPAVMASPLVLLFLWNA